MANWRLRQLHAGLDRLLGPRHVAANVDLVGVEVDEYVARQHAILVADPANRLLDRQ